MEMGRWARGLFPAPPTSTESAAYTSILFSPPPDRPEALSLSPLGWIPCERQIEKACGCRVLTKALLNPTLRGYGQVQHPDPSGLYSAALFRSPFAFLPSQVSIKSASLSTEGCCSLKAGKLAVSCKPHPLAALTLAFHFSSGLGFLSAASLLQRSLHKPPF